MSSVPSSWEQTATWDQTASTGPSSSTASTSPPANSDTDISPADENPAPRTDLMEEVLVCIDVECHCHNQSWKLFQQGVRSTKHRVCEVGITVFDSPAFTNSKTDPGDRHVNAWNHFKTFNIGIKEHEHKKHGSHARWCKRASAEDFLFGKTKWIFKNQFKNEFVRTVQKSIGHKKGASCREIIFLVFGQNDKVWLRDMGLNLYNEFPNCSVMDMQEFSPAMTLGYRLGKQLVGASDLFVHLGIPVGNKHNGGNDSRFELQAFLAMYNLTEEQWVRFSQGRALDALPKSWDGGDDEDDVSAVMEEFRSLKVSNIRVG